MLCCPHTELLRMITTIDISCDRFLSIDSTLLNGSSSESMVMNGFITHHDVTQYFDEEGIYHHCLAYIISTIHKTRVVHQFHRILPVTYDVSRLLHLPHTPTIL